MAKTWFLYLLLASVLVATLATKSKSKGKGNGKGSHENSGSDESSKECIEGPPGPVGPSGPPGPKGDRGQPGIDGIPGIKGYPGVNGLPGAVGIPGSTGPRGSKGENGNTGFPGVRGMKGEPAIIDPGLLPKGDKGDIGFRGYDGLPGRKGEPGVCDDKNLTVVAFTVQATEVEPDDDDYQVVPIQRVITNTSHVYGPTFGLSTSEMIFQAPVDGLFAFHVAVVANGNGATPTVLFLNDDPIVTTARSNSTAVGVYPHGTAHVTLTLRKRDLVVLKTRPYSGFLSSFLNIYSPSDITFSGYLINTLQ